MNRAWGGTNQIPKYFFGEPLGGSSRDEVSG